MRKQNIASGVPPDAIPAQTQSQSHPPVDQKAEQAKYESPPLLTQALRVLKQTDGLIVSAEIASGIGQMQYFA